MCKRLGGSLWSKIGSSSPVLLGYVNGPGWVPERAKGPTQVLEAKPSEASGVSRGEHKGSLRDIRQKEHRASTPKVHA